VKTDTHTPAFVAHPHETKYPQRATILGVECTAVWDGWPRPLGESQVSDNTPGVFTVDTMRRLVRNKYYSPSLCTLCPYYNSPLNIEHEKCCLGGLPAWLFWAPTSALVALRMGVPPEELGKDLPWSR
jgi:hypothetical protein